MKTLTFVFGLLLIPSVSFAAPLTNDQATSLISVVQSAPGVPASAFTNLITAFSNITVPQAESLINVVQQAVGVPADAFVNLLISFTVDMVQPAPAPAPAPEPVLGSNPQPVTERPAPVVESVVMKELKIFPNSESGGKFYTVKVRYREDGKGKVDIPITLSVSSGELTHVGMKGIAPKTDVNGEAEWVYYHDITGIVTFTAEANGVIETWKLGVTAR